MAAAPISAPVSNIFIKCAVVFGRLEGGGGAPASLPFGPLPFRATGAKSDPEKGPLQKEEEEEKSKEEANGVYCRLQILWWRGEYTMNGRKPR